MEIRIEGQKVLFRAENIPALSYTRYDVFNPSDRHILRTNNIKLPNVAQNRKIFKFPDAINTTTNSINKHFDIEIFDVSRTFKGVCYITGINNDNISIQCQDEAVTVLNSLNAKLSDVDFSDNDTFLNEANIDSHKVYSEDDVIYWGKMCNHVNLQKANTDLTTGSNRTKYSRPLLSVNALLKKTIDLSGVSFIQPAIQLALNMNSTDFIFTSYEKTLNGVYSGQFTDLNVNVFSTAITVFTDRLEVGSRKTSLRIKGACSASGATLRFKATDISDPSKFSESKIFIDGAVDLDFKTTDFFNSSGTKIEIFADGSIDFSNCSLYTTESENDADLSTNPFLNYKIKVNENLPDMSFKDLYRLICVLSFNTHKYDPFFKTFSFKKIVSGKKLASADWSDKLIVDSANIMSAEKGLYTENRIGYSNDESVDKELGEHVFYTYSDKIEGSGDYFRLKFSATDDGVIDGETIAHVKKYNDSSEVTNLDIKNRVLLANGDKAVFAPLWFSSLKENYNDIIEALEKPVISKCEILINKLEFLKLDETESVYLQKYNSSFIILEASAFITGVPTKFTLLRHGR